MLYKYTVTTTEGERSSGAIDAPGIDIAIQSLQARNFIIVSISPAEGDAWNLNRALTFLNRVKARDIVILSRQMATLFEAKVPAIESFKLIAGETQNQKLKKSLSEIIDDVKGGVFISQALAKHPDIFSKFYVNMIRAGEEAGKLGEIFSYLADYLERFYELTAKTKKALIYPIFVVATFIVVVSLMMAFVIPRLTVILTEVGQELPIYTRIVIGASNFVRDFGVFILLALIAGAVFLWRYSKTESGKLAIARFELSVPYIGTLFKKFYISRITDSLETSITSGISLVRGLEISADIVGNEFYRRILSETVDEVRSGKPLSSSFSKYENIPPLVYQMIKIGEESGKLDFILKTLSRFYKREVENDVETLISLIEPAMIVVLGLGVGILLIAILGPIYNIASGI